ncbi:hypothetical protein PRZ48_000983 [Zasmidium cellare]|uniref:Zn(2)-C6 fungal-type domain-containing protein n=1 Tax=Zasmidium cellare TaxID=395010 RepID=A0ABR0F2E0_ZASCE|nr:hypothetical protein PRZ48_000983 [Zasmidium cellare]
MPESQEESPGEDYFNDLTQQPSNKADETTNGERNGSQEDSNGQVPKPKRIACVLCRKRKLKCDGVKPSCGTCTRLQHDCSYDEVRRKSGPKRGYVKALEARLAQVETLLKTQDDGTTGQNGSNGNGQGQANGSKDGLLPDFGNPAIGRSNVNMLPHMQQTRTQHEFPTQSPTPHSMLNTMSTGDINGTSEEPFPWEMIGLGLDEPLPNQDVINELNQAYFERVHPSLPMIHRPRYYAAMNLAPHMRPPVCLRYAMWANAAAVTDKFEGLQEHFYLRARKYIQQDEMKGHGESMITIAHCQTWALIATHEFKHMYFPRAWMSAGRSSRLAQMMGLHRLDGQGLDVKQCLPPPRDWTEREERRRTFWMAFCVDRYSSIGTGWPMTFEEGDVMTSLPTDEESFDLSKPVKTMTLFEALEPSGTQGLSPFAGVVLMACLFGRNLTHLHRPTPDDRDDDLNGEFWKRHRAMDNILLNTALSLPDPLRLPSGLNSPNIVFMNMNIHTSTICLHQAAIFKADKNRMPARISAESKVRCITAAAEIASIMRQISHLDLSAMNPFISFCLYVASRVFVQYLKSRPKDAQVKASLQFLLSAMHAIKRKNPLTESFLVQLDVDLEGAGLEDSDSLRAQMQKTRDSVANRMPGCPQEHLGMPAVENGRIPTYGDMGLAAYNKPDQNSVDPSHLQQTDSMGITSGLGDSLSHNQPGGTFNFSLPNRQRTPGSFRSPADSLNQPEMDTSPDGSNNDQQTPGSSTHSQTNNPSSHTSNTAYSPQNGTNAATANMQHASDPTQMSGIFDPSDPAFADFDMTGFTTNMDTQPSGFVLPSNWSGNGGSSSGMTPGSGSNGVMTGLSEMMGGMTNADWNQVLESFTGWETGVVHDQHVHNWGR